jgi:hypothetical protein
MTARGLQLLQELHPAPQMLLVAGSSILFPHSLLLLGVHLRGLPVTFVTILEDNMVGRTWALCLAYPGLSMVPRTSCAPPGG